MANGICEPRGSIRPEHPSLLTSLRAQTTPEGCERGPGGEGKRLLGGLSLAVLRAEAPLVLGMVPGALAPR